MKFNHPETCWVHIPTDNSVGVVKWGESGYYKTDYPHNYTSELVTEMNDRSGYSRMEIHAMQICSMANLPDNDEAWEKHFQMVCEMMAKKGGC